MVLAAAPACTPSLARALALCCATAWAAAPAAAEPPTLPAKAATVEGFVPAGWLIEQQQKVDLNRDGRPDAVLLLKAAAAAPAPGGRSPERVLAVLQRQPGGWLLAGANAGLVPQMDLAAQEDPLENGELTAKPGSFSLSLGLTSTAGSYESAVLRYRFRLQPGCVRLIGYDRLQTHRATLDTQDLSINFLTGAVLHTQGNAQTDASTRRRERLVANPRRCLPELDSALSFQPLGAPR